MPELSPDERQRYARQIGPGVLSWEGQKRLKRSTALVARVGGMGGPAATDDLGQAHLTQAWLATSDDTAARVSGGYFYHLMPRAANPQAHDPALQERLLAICREASGIDLPG